MESEKRPNSSNRNPRGSLHGYARWSGLAFQMVGLVLIGYFSGKKIDNLTENENSVYTLVCVVVAVIASMLLAIRSIQKSDNNQKGE